MSTPEGSQEQKNEPGKKSGRGRGRPREDLRNERILFRRFAGEPDRDIAMEENVGASTVTNVMRRARREGMFVPRPPREQFPGKRFDEVTSYITNRPDPQAPISPTDLGAALRVSKQRASKLLKNYRKYHEEVLHDTSVPPTALTGGRPARSN